MVVDGSTTNLIFLPVSVLTVISILPYKLQGPVGAAAHDVATAAAARDQIMRAPTCVVAKRNATPQGRE